MDRYCHIAVNALHYGLRVARAEGHDDLRHDHAKFYSVQLALQDLPLEVGNEYAGKGRCRVVSMLLVGPGGVVWWFSGGDTLLVCRGSVVDFCFVFCLFVCLFCF